MDARRYLAIFNAVDPTRMLLGLYDLYASKDISIGDRHSDFFIFSKRFIGGERTGYCRTTSIEQVHPEPLADKVIGKPLRPRIGKHSIDLVCQFFGLM